MHIKDTTPPTYLLDLRHRTRFGVEQVFVTIKPGWGPYRAHEMSRIAANTFRAKVELSETDRYQFHEIPDGTRRGNLKHMIGYSLRDQMLKKNPINFRPSYPFLEVVDGRRFVRLETYPDVFRKVSLRFYGEQGEIDFPQQLEEFAEWHLPANFHLKQFRFLFESERQTLLWPASDQAAFTWPDDMESCDTQSAGAGLVLQLEPEKKISHWLKQIQTFGQDFDSILLPPFFQSTDESCYQVRNYHELNPKFGSQSELDAIFHWARRHQKKLILDMPFRFCSNRHTWYVESRRNFFEKNPDDSVRYWAMNPACPLLNWEEDSLQQELISIMQFWQLRSGAWGFRIDCAHELPMQTYQGFLAQAAEAGLSNLYGEAWDYHLPQPKTTNYSLPIFMQHHSQGWPSFPIMNRLLRKFIFESGHSHLHHSLNYFSSHDTRYLYISDKLYIAYFLLSLFLPGSHVYFIRDLEGPIGEIDFKGCFNWYQKFRHHELDMSGDAEGLSLVRGNWVLRFTKTFPSHSCLLKHNFSGDWWVAVEQR
jgi:hypothetical protein